MPQVYKRYSKCAWILSISDFSGYMNRVTFKMISEKCHLDFFLKNRQSVLLILYCDMGLWPGAWRQLLDRIILPVLKIFAYSYGTLFCGSLGTIRTRFDAIAIDANWTQNNANQTIILWTQPLWQLPLPLRFSSKVCMNSCLVKTPRQYFIWSVKNYANSDYWLALFVEKNEAQRRQHLERLSLSISSPFTEWRTE